MAFGFGQFWLRTGTPFGFGFLSVVLGGVPVLGTGHILWCVIGFWPGGAIDCHGVSLPRRWVSRGYVPACGPASRADSDPDDGAAPLPAAHTLALSCGAC